MKSQLFLLVGMLALANVIFAQNERHPTVYKPFSPQEISQVTGVPTDQTQIQTDSFSHGPQRPHHNKNKHYKPSHPKELEETTEEQYVEQLTEEEREIRRQERIRYNKMFKCGMIIGTAVLAFILCKFCMAKRRRCRMMRQQVRNQQVQMQQPYIYNVSPHPYPLNQQQPVQMGRPLYQQQRHMPRPHSQEVRPQQPIQPQPQVIRGRPHESFIRQTQPQNTQIEAQIRYHEEMINQLRESKRREEMEMRRNMVPINTTESFQSVQPIRRNRNIPVGQPVFEKDANSSFASEYPEI